MPPKKIVVKRSMKRRIPLARRVRPVPSVYGPVRKYLVKSCETVYVDCKNATSYGWVFGDHKLISYETIVAILKNNGVIGFDDVKVLGIDIHMSIFLVPESHSTTTPTFKAAIGYPSDSNYHPTKGTLTFPNVTSTSEVNRDYLVGGFILRDAEHQESFKFSSVDELLSHPTMQHNIVAEPNMIHFKKRWTPTEPSERDWLTAGSKLFTIYGLCTNMDQNGWFKPGSQAAYARRFAIIRRLSVSVETRGRTTTVARTFESALALRTVASDFECLDMTES